MSDNREKLAELLNLAAIDANLVPGGTPDSHLTVVTVRGVKIVVLLIENTVHLVVNWGYLPKDNLAPLFRRFLATNYNLNNGGICLNDQGRQLAWKNSHPMSGLTAEELSAMLDMAAVTYYQILTPLVTEFGIPQEAA